MSAPLMQTPVSTFFCTAASEGVSAVAAQIEIVVPEVGCMIPTLSKLKLEQMDLESVASSSAQSFQWDS
jgi:hypothetical protein